MGRKKKKKGKGQGKKDEKFQSRGFLGGGGGKKDPFSIKTAKK